MPRGSSRRPGGSALLRPPRRASARSTLARTRRESSPERAVRPPRSALDQASPVLELAPAQELPTPRLRQATSARLWPPTAGVRACPVPGHRQRPAVMPIAVDLLTLDHAADHGDGRTIARAIARGPPRPPRRLHFSGLPESSPIIQPPFRPEAPKATCSASSTATDSLGSARRGSYAVQRPVKPPPRMQTSTSCDPRSDGRTGHDPGWSSRNEGVGATRVERWVSRGGARPLRSWCASDADAASYPAR